MFFLCSTLTRIAQNDFLPHNVYVYFLCGLVCTWIHESDAKLICMRFFSDVLAYCVVLQAFICHCSFVRCSWCACVRARLCVLFIGIVQRNWACLTWKSAIEIKLLLLLLLCVGLTGALILSVSKCGTDWSDGTLSVAMYGTNWTLFLCLCVGLTGALTLFLCLCVGLTEPWHSVSMCGTDWSPDTFCVYVWDWLEPWYSVSMFGTDWSPDTFCVYVWDWLEPWHCVYVWDWLEPWHFLCLCVGLTGALALFLWLCVGLTGALTLFLCLCVWLTGALALSVSMCGTDWSPDTFCVYVWDWLEPWHSFCGYVWD